MTKIKRLYLYIFLIIVSLASCVSSPARINTKGYNTTTLSDPIIVIRKMDFANTDKNGTIIGSYGTTFDSTILRFLKPRITYDSIGYSSGGITLDVKIIKPDGNISSSSSSPRGYTYNDTLEVQAGESGETITLNGWGNENGSIYSAGTYTCEIWNKAERLYSANFTVTTTSNKESTAATKVTEPPASVPVVPNITITKIDFANIDENRTIIGSYGTTFESTALKFLAPRITYDSIGSTGEIVLDIRIIRPDKEMIRFSSSSDGYPYTFDQTLGLQADMTRKSITLIGIGDENGYTYSAPGTYTCEIWSNGKKLYSANFTVRAGTEIIFTYNGPPQGIDVKLYYNEELLGAIASENTIRKTIPSQGVFTFKAQLGDRIEELSLESRGSTTINVNIIARRTPSGIAFTEFIANRTPVEIRYVNIDYLNVRDRQNADAAELDVITQDTRVEILEEYMKSSWVRIKYYTNETGFVNGALLTSKQPPLVITSVKVGNGDYNGRWLTNAGDPLYSSQMRSLRPVVTYDAKFDGDVTFFVKIIHPNGEVEKLSSIPPDLPSGFSYSGKFHVENSNNQTLYLSNFGNSDKSIYQAGEWTVEIWYNNKQRLWSEKVTILP